MLDFGETQIGDVSILGFKIENLGEQELEILDLSVEAPDECSYYTNSVGDDLGPGATRLYDFTFTPVTAGGRAGFLYIESNAPEEPDAVVDLIGFGVD